MTAEGAMPCAGGGVAGLVCSVAVCGGGDDISSPWILDGVARKSESGIFTSF